MSNDGNEKYAKAAKQSKQTMYGMIVVGFAFIILIFGTTLLSTNNNSHSGSVGSASSSLGGVANQNKPITNTDAHAAAKTTAGEASILTTAKDSKSSYLELRQMVQMYDALVRQIKSQVDIFEIDPKGQEAAKALQDATRTLLNFMYGKDTEYPYRIKVELEFQPTIPDYNEKGKDGFFVMELAPSALQPHSIYTFLEIARHWHGGAFHRVAPHVLQVQVQTHTIRHLAFQEYSPKYPHKERTVGYAGRPSGPAWYVSTQDNSKNHGPGSQQKKNPYEADSCFGTVIQGYDETILRIRKAPGGAGMGFIGDAKKHVLITQMKIMVPEKKRKNGDADVAVEYEPWEDIYLPMEADENK